MSEPKDSQQTTRKRRLIVTPWKDKMELKHIIDSIYGEHSDTKSMEHAFLQMRIWRSRRMSLCPAGVLATLELLEVKIKDDNNIENSSVLQALYSFAIMRFFNFMSSTMQEHNLRSMYDIAQKLGLPSFTVDIRHICAHGQVLPPLGLLRRTLKFCINWLKDYYWIKQYETICEGIAPIVKPDQIEKTQNIAKLLVIYERSLEAYCKGAEDIKTAALHLKGKKYLILQHFCTDNINIVNLNDVFEAIVENLIILAKEGLPTKDFDDMFIQNILDMKLFRTVYKDEMFEKVIEVTRNFFRMLSGFNFIEKIFVRLLEVAENDELGIKRREGAGFWCHKIALGFLAFHKCKNVYEAHLKENPKMKDVDFSSYNIRSVPKNIRKLMIYGGVDIKNTILFGDPYRHPWVWLFELKFVEYHLKRANFSTVPVLKSLLYLTDPALNELTIERLNKLIDIYYNQNSENVFDEEDEHMEIEEQNSSQSTFLSTPVDESVNVKNFGIMKRKSYEKSEGLKSNCLGIAF